MFDIAWPIWTLEFTPSSGGVDSYPLAVGIASWTSPDAVITTWSTPIDTLGIEDWREKPGAHAEKLGLTPSALSAGMSPHKVATLLNDIFMTSVVYGRGGTADIHSANRLNLAAKVWSTYSLNSWRDVYERHPEKVSEAWEMIRNTDGDAAEMACATMRAIALMMGREPDCRSVPTMAISLPM